MDFLILYTCILKLRLLEILHVDDEIDNLKSLK